MKKLESTFINMVVVLTVITLIAAGTLGTLHSVTSEPIALSKIAKQEAAIKAVLPEYDRLDVGESENGLKVYRAYSGSEFVGAAVEAASRNGFSGEVRVMVGFNKDGSINDYAVLDQKETPGLGTKMVTWFKEDKDKRSILTKNPSIDNLTVSKDGGSVDAITAATISSRAFLEAVVMAYGGLTLGANEPAEIVVDEAVVPTEDGDELEVLESEQNDSIY